MTSIRIDPTFAALRAREAAIGAISVAGLTLRQLEEWFDQPGRSLLSANAKTGCSLDFPVGHTCSPTPLCSAVCYAFHGPKGAPAPAAWTKSLRKRLRNMRYIQLAPPRVAAERISREQREMQRRWEKRARLDFLRVNGSGELFPELVRTINTLAVLRRDLPIWVVTRRPDLARFFDVHPNLWVQLSVDPTTPRAQLIAIRQLVKEHPRCYTSFLRTDADQDPGDSPIIFNMKRRDDLPVEPARACPADAGRLDLDNIRGVGGTACARCRRCFSAAVLRR